ncbi:MAG: hypothetical protein JSW61_01310 [Candidatus Thorarchaeota archaeon]|nr:MAG: hypothetical protein JSW61_01310 [Candidatus Thorarchaeota archaeon]
MSVVRKLDKLATTRNLILAIVSSAVIVAVMGYATQTLVYDVYGDVTMPDTRVVYTFEEIAQVFDTLGSDGLRIWSQVHLLDLLFPIAYCLSIVFGITMEVRRAYPDKPELKGLIALPIMAAAADFLENALIASQIAAYPGLSPSIILAASLITTVKWALILLSFGVVFGLLLVIPSRSKRTNSAVKQ